LGLSVTGSGLQGIGNQVNDAIPEKAQIGFFKVQFKKGHEEGSTAAASPRPTPDAPARPVYGTSGPIMTGFTKVAQITRLAVTWLQTLACAVDALLYTKDQGDDSSMLTCQQVDSRKISQHHHHHNAKNAEVVDMLEQKRAELVREAAHDLKHFKKKGAAYE